MAFSCNTGQAIFRLKFRDIFGKPKREDKCTTRPDKLPRLLLGRSRICTRRRSPSCVLVPLPAMALCSLPVSIVPNLCFRPLPYIVPFVCPSIRLVYTQWPHCSRRRIVADPFIYYSGRQRHFPLRFRAFWFLRPINFSRPI